MSRVSRSDLLDLGKEIVNSISQTVLDHSQRTVIGAEIGTVGSSGDMIKVGDDSADSIATSKLTDFFRENHSVAVVCLSDKGPNFSHDIR